MSDISIFLPDLRGGGAERVQLDLAHEFTRLGHSISFVLMQATGEYLPEAHAHFTVHDLGVARARQVPFALARYLRSHSADALLVAMWPLTTIAPIAARLSGFRGHIVVSEHAILSAQYSDWGRGHHIALRASMALGYRFASARIGVSRGVVQDIARLARIPKSAFQAIHNPVASRPPPNLQTMVASDGLWGAQHGERILTVGRFKPVNAYCPLLNQQ